MTMETDLAYVAGFLDAPGCFTVGRILKRGTWHYILHITRNNMVAISFIQQVLGGYIHEHREGTSIRYVWGKSGKKVLDIVTMIEPFLISKVQHVAIMKSLEGMEHDLDASHELIDKLHQLNVRGKHYDEDRGRFDDK